MEFKKLYEDGNLYRFCAVKLLSFWRPVYIGARVLFNYSDPLLGNTQSFIGLPRQRGWRTIFLIL